MDIEKGEIYLHISEKSCNFAAESCKDDERASINRYIWAMNDYRFINIDQEPTEEQLEQLMHEVAVEAKERHDKAHAAYFAHIDQMIKAIWVVIVPK